MELGNKAVLYDAGIDYEKALARFSSKVDFYEGFLLDFTKDKTFSELEKALKSGDFEEAYRFSHSLKGSSGNLSIMKLYESISVLTDALRAPADIEKADEIFPVTKAVYESSCKAIKEYFSE